MTKKNSTHASKRRNGIAAAILLILILITGTFAWQSMQQMAFNPMWREGNLGGRIHDRFQITDEPIRDLTIFAENFGNEDIFLRIRLREFLAIDAAEEGFGGSLRHDPDTWPIYLAEPENAMIRLEDTYTYDIGDAGVRWTMGQTAPFVYMPTFNHATYPATAPLGNVVPPRYNFANAHRMTEATGNAVDWLSASTPNRALIGPDAEFEHISEILEAGSQTGPGLNVLTHQTLDDGTRNNWRVGDTVTSRYIYTEVSTVGLTTVIDLNLGDERVHRAQHNLMPSISGEGLPANFNHSTFNGIITIEQWNEWDRPTGDFWIMDTTNDEGWFYWNGYLPHAPGLRTEATSLLLAAVSLEDVDGDWEYVVVTDGIFFNDEGIDYLEPPISEDALPIFRPEEEEYEDLVFPPAQEDCAEIVGQPNLFTDETGVEWCVIFTERHGDYVYSMMLTRFVHRLDHIGINGNYSSRHQADGYVFVLWPETTQSTDGPEGRERLNLWMRDTDFVSSNLRRHMVHATIPSINTEPYPNLQIGQPWRDDTTALSRPIVGSTVELGESAIFVPSSADINVGLPLREDDFGSIMANGRFAQFEGGTPAIHWLRTPGAQSPGNSMVVNGRDVVGTSSALSTAPTLGFRPAVWVRHLADEEEIIEPTEPITTVPSYVTVTFDLNGGEGYIEPTVFDGDVLLVFDQNRHIPTRTNFVFIGWSTAPTPTDGDEDTPDYLHLPLHEPNDGERNHWVMENQGNEDIILRAVWTEELTITFEAGNIDDENVELPDTIYSRQGRMEQIPYDIPEGEGFEFIAWASYIDPQSNDVIRAHEPGDYVFLWENEDIVLTAIWNRNRLVVSPWCDVNGEAGDSEYTANIFVDSTGWEWCVIDSVDNEGDVYYMLLSRRIISDVVPLEDPLGVSWGQRIDSRNLEGPEERARLNEWSRNRRNISQELWGQIVHVYLPSISPRDEFSISEEYVLTEQHMTLPIFGSGLSGFENSIFIPTSADLHFRLQLENERNPELILGTGGFSATNIDGHINFYRTRDIVSDVLGVETVIAAPGPLNGFTITGRSAFSVHNFISYVRPAIWIRPERIYEYRLTLTGSTVMNVNRGSSLTVNALNDSNPLRSVTVQRRRAGTNNTWTNVLPLPEQAPVWSIVNSQGQTSEAIRGGVSIAPTANNPWQPVISATENATPGGGRYIRASWTTPSGEVIHTQNANPGSNLSDRPINVN